MLLPPQEDWTSARSLSCMGISTAQFFPLQPQQVGSLAPLVLQSEPMSCLPVTDAKVGAIPPGFSGV